MYTNLYAKRQSHVTTGDQSAGMSWYQVHSGTCDQILFFCLKVAVLSPWGALSDERLGLSPVSHCQQYLIYIVHVTCFMYMQYILDLCQHRLSTADYATTSVAYVTTAV
jgi:hypothetical protein